MTLTPTGVIAGAHLSVQSLSLSNSYKMALHAAVVVLFVSKVIQHSLNIQGCLVKEMVSGTEQAFANLN